MQSSWFTKEGWRDIYLPTVLGMITGAILTWLLLPALQSGSQSVSLPAEDNQIQLESANPLQLRIPTASINTTFTEPLSLNDDGSIAVPDTYEQVGLYAHGPTPGELGPAVILGHVDSFRGPAIFYNLKEVTLGDKIYVDRDDGITAVFTVTEISAIDQEQFPTEKVYGDLDFAGLRLITCDGSFDHAEQRYSHNLIVYAELTLLE